MGFSYFDFRGKRYWMGDGNVRTCRELEAEKPQRTEVLVDFLRRNAVSVTTPEEYAFKHPFEQTFPAEQIAPGFAGVPQSEAPPGEVPIPTGEPEAVGGAVKMEDPMKPSGEAENPLVTKKASK